MALLALAACSQPDAVEEEAGFETVDVGAGVDSNIRPEDDIKAQVRERGLLGVLPGDFPDDFWVYRPGSIVDLTSAPGGRGVVSVRTQGAVDAVSARLRDEQARRGWIIEGDHSALSFVKDDRRVDVALKARGNETWVTIDYPPR
ncbi:MAG: hypothetical protein VYE73_05705 [Acidobacteriota bacterium]|nr:hypothetical protein [Acidobacteriota bacterium]